MIDAHDRLHPACRTSARTPIATSSARCAISQRKGMKRLLFDIRGNPGRAARPGDQGRRTSSCRKRQDDRLHARPRAELGSGLPRDRRRASSPTCRSWCSPTATAPARRRSSPARCRITIARYIVGETTFGKALVQSVYRDQRRRRARADDGALLHAERPADSAAVGRDASTSI